MTARENVVAADCIGRQSRHGRRRTATRQRALRVINGSQTSWAVTDGDTSAAACNPEGDCNGSQTS